MMLLTRGAHLIYHMYTTAIVTSSLPGILPNSELVHDYLSPSLDVIGIFGGFGLL